MWLQMHYLEKENAGQSQNSQIHDLTINNKF